MLKIKINEKKKISNIKVRVNSFEINLKPKNKKNRR